ncbi:MAG: ATP-binding cassette domain-containing protein [Coriobacteriales bacterium]|jgi:D-methionine transport system ATP-binding protein|nr:ATP-binding cassette domain-containing protein [Coriobacteriales bacterium]
MSEAFIQVRNLNKAYIGRGQTVEVLKDVSLDIDRGDIFGIVGSSGAGKSTFLRCLNRLEEPDSGEVRIDGSVITGLSHKELLAFRRKFGMIFQQFNLLDARSVARNVEFSLTVARQAKEQRQQRVNEILDLVGLTDRRDFYPGQLSGGQRQRVGIARALANEPKVLLSDEATSALDPETALSILDLIKAINRKFGLTIIVVTHQLEVIKYLCRHVAVLENGRIVEQGSTREVLTNPQSHTMQVFVEVNASLTGGFLQGGEGI